MNLVPPRLARALFAALLLAASGASAVPASPPEAPSAGDPQRIDSLARCAAAYTMHVKLLKLTGEAARAEQAAPLADWHFFAAVDAAGRDHVEARFKHHYQGYMATEGVLRKMDTAAEAEQARVLVTRLLAELNADLDDCELLKKRVLSEAALRDEQGCERGDVRACGRAGWAHEKGEGVAKDPGRAAGLYRKACYGAHPRSCYNLGYLMYTGQGVAKDSSGAAALFGKACDGGDAGGCSNFGLLHERGDGAPKDAARAAQLYEKACDSGHALGCSNLARLFEAGVGVPKDDARAAELYGKACKGGNAKACAAAKRIAG